MLLELGPGRGLKPSSSQGKACREMPGDLIMPFLIKAEFPSQGKQAASFLLQLFRGWLFFFFFCRWLSLFKKKKKPYSSCFENAVNKRVHSQG